MSSNQLDEWISNAAQALQDVCDEAQSASNNPTGNDQRPDIRSLLSELDNLIAGNSEPNTLSTLTILRSAQKDLHDIKSKLQVCKDFIYSIYSEHTEAFRCGAFERNQKTGKIKSADFEITENGKLICTDKSIYTDNQIKQMQAHIMQWIKL